MNLCHWIISLIIKASIQLDPISKFKIKLRYRQAPVVYRHCSLFRDVLFYQEHQLDKSLLRTKCTFTLFICVCFIGIHKLATLSLVIFRI